MAKINNKKNYVFKKNIIFSAVLLIIVIGIVGSFYITKSFAVIGQNSVSNCSGVLIPAGSSIQAAINANTGMTTFCLGPGVHRLTQVLNPKSGNTFWGEYGAIVSGSKIITGWTQANGVWSVSGELPADYTDSSLVQCEDLVNNTCTKAEWIFVNNVHLDRVSNLGALASGKFYSDYVANKIYIVDEPTGKTVEMSSQRAAFASGAANITVRNLVVEKFASFSQHAAIESINNTTAQNWLIVDSEFRDNHAAGVKVFGDGTQIRNSKFYNNGQTGLTVYKSENVLVDGNEMYNNNADGFWVNDGENGGLKISKSTYATVTNNYVYSNNGLGIWFDGDNKYASVSGNYLSNNASDGLRYEISFDADIYNNTLVNNGLNRGRGICNCISGGAALTVNTSSNVTVRSNIFYDNDNSIAATWSDRGISPTYGVAWDLANLKVYNNIITMMDGLQGLKASDANYYTAKGNSFYNNTYHLSSLVASNFYWQNGNRTKDQWMAYGQDVTGTFDTVISAAPPPPSFGQLAGDLNTDSKVNIFDLSILLSKWNTTDTISDLNNDGSVNVFDLSILLSNWSP